MKKMLALTLAFLCTLPIVGAFAAEGAAPEPTVIRFMTNDHYQSIMNNEILTFAEMDKKLNIQLQFEVTANTEYNEKVNLVLASGDYPHIMRADPAIMSQYYDTGIVYQLDELARDKVPNLYTAAEKVSSLLIKNITSDDGHLWYFPKIEYSDYNLFPYINGDWLDELGLAAPTTTDELYDVLVAFKAAKGDDCIPWMAGPWTDLYSTVIQYFGSDLNWMHLSEGEYVYGPYQRADRLKAALAFMNRCYQEGLIDRDFLSRDDDNKNSLISQNKVGFFITWGDNGAMWSEGGIDGLNFRIPAPLSGGGEKPYVPTTNAVASCYYVTKSAEPVLDKVLEMVNYLYSDEGADLFSYGTEGYTYTTQPDGTKAFTDVILQHELGGVNGRRQLGINPNPFLHVSLGTAWDALMHPESVAGLQRHKPLHALPLPILSPTVEESAEQTQLFADINKYVSARVPQFIVGELSLESDWDTFQNTLKDMQVERYIEITDAQYQRWLAR